MTGNALTRRTIVTVVAALAVIAAALSITAPAQAAGSQLMWFDGPLEQKFNGYPQTYPSSFATVNSWAPYQEGRAYARVTISGKRSALPMSINLCLWKHKSPTQRYFYETCSMGLAQFVADGTYFIDLGKPNSSAWWKKPQAGVRWDWNEPFDIGRWMVKDIASGKLMATRSCGAYCFQPADQIDLHVPFTVDSEIILVAPGSSLAPPANWVAERCPTAWAPGCSGTPPSTIATTTSGAPTTTTAQTTTTIRNSTTTTQLPGTTTTTQPATTTTQPGSTTTAPIGEWSVAFITGSSTMPSGDRPLADALLAAGYSVANFDDDAVPTTAQLQSYDAVVVSSSVMPNKVPARLRDLTVGLVNLESYAVATLGLGTNGKDVVGQTTLAVTPGHPIAAALTGNVGVGVATTFSVSDPAGQAEVVARTTGGAGAVYAFEKGTTTGSGAAAARRVVAHLAYPAPQAANANGMGLFVRSVGWAASRLGGVTPPPNAAIVVIAGSSPAPSGDAPIVSRLAATGRTVVVVDDDALQPGSLAGAAGVVITSSVVPTKVPAWVWTVSTPILNTEAYLMQAAGLATAQTELAGQTTLTLDPTHPVSAGLTGRVAVSETAPFNSFTPSATATVVATGAGGGAAIAVSNASPGRRVGFHFSYPAPPRANAAGWSLFDASVTWLLGA